MSFTTTQFVPFDRSEVWQWHTRSGAIARLTPPFLPMTPIRQAASLADGTTVFAFPAGLKWVARHEVSSYRRERQFVDECVSAPIRKFAHWRHEHIFADADGGMTLCDRVETRVPAATLRAAFAYRQHQLLADLTAGARLRSLGDAPVRVAMTGSRGLVGRALTAFLTTMGIEVIQLVRSGAKEGQRLWDPPSPAPDLLTGATAVVHLAGEAIGGRFSDSHKQNLRTSRIEPTEKLAQLASATPSVNTFVSASAIGIYGPSCGADGPVDITDPPGEGFLAQLCTDWEAAAASCTKRTVLMRTGLVLSGRGGLLPVFKALFSAGLGGRLGDGNQWMSWISIEDLVYAYAAAVLDPTCTGAINAVSPQPVTNAEFTAQLATALKRPKLLSMPSIGPKLLLGNEGAMELALADQQVASSLEHLSYPTLEHCLRHELGGERLADEH
ncbi:TIGR01777 family oxidoreductase [Corynebacterium sp. H127]|uniref:TIGR01777 family oxidoreductase n=1 Tax=Corynebacterium sp. H127 TaxID=3133418 RepID=UPI0030A41ACD